MIIWPLLMGGELQSYLIVPILMDLVHKFKQIIAIEKKKYRQKGPTNTLIGFVLLFAMIYIPTAIAADYWPAVIENKVAFCVIGTFICHFGIQVVAYLLHLPGYMGISQFYEKHKLNPKGSRPWQRSNWKEMLIATIKNLIINQILVYPTLLYLGAKNSKIRVEGFPQMSQVFGQVMFLYLLDDFFFYWLHRLFHEFKFLYKLHKVHHEFDTLFTVLNQYFHPIDFIFGAYLPSALCFAVLGPRAHAYTLFYWTCFKVLNSCQSHSGYEFEFSPYRVLPLTIGSSFHDYHHSHNVGTYCGRYYFLDLLFGTGGDYFKNYLAKEAVQ